MPTLYADLPTDTEPMRDATPRPPKPSSGLASIDYARRLYVQHCGDGYTCLGFDVLQRQYDALWGEMLRVVGPDAVNYLPRPEETAEHAVGTEGAYAAWEELGRRAFAHHRRTGYRFGCELSPQLCGLEGCRVEVIDREGDAPRRFNVGRSTGWVPCLLELRNTRSSGGVSAMMRYHSVRVVRRIK